MVAASGRKTPLIAIVGALSTHGFDGQRQRRRVEWRSKKCANRFYRCRTETFDLPAHGPLTTVAEERTITVLIRRKQSATDENTD